MTDPRVEAGAVVSGDLDGYEVASTPESRARWDDTLRRRRERPETRSVFDSRETPYPYGLSTTIDGPGGPEYRSHESMPDPFVTHRIHLRPSWVDRLWFVFSRKPYEIEVRLDAPPEIIEAISELDENYRGQHGSQRRARSDAEFSRALGSFTETIGDDSA